MFNHVHTNLSSLVSDLVSMIVVSIHCLWAFAWTEQDAISILVMIDTVRWRDEAASRESLCLMRGS